MTSARGRKRTRFAKRASHDWKTHAPSAAHTQGAQRPSARAGRARVPPTASERRGEALEDLARVALEDLVLGLRRRASCCRRCSASCRRSSARSRGRCRARRRPSPTRTGCCRSESRRAAGRCRADGRRRCRSRRCSSTDSFSGGRFSMSARPRKRPQWIRHGAAAVRNDELEVGKVLEEVRRHHLHERDGVGREVVRARRLEVRRVARLADVDHRRALRARTSSRRADTKYRSARPGPLKKPPLVSGFRLQPTKPSSSTQRSSSRTEASIGAPGDCGSCATPTKFFGIQLREPIDQLVAVLRPRLARRRVAEVMPHPARARARRS